MIRALDIALFNYLNAWAGSSRIFDGVIIFLASYFSYILVVIFCALLFFAPYPYFRPTKMRIFWVVICSGVVARLGATEIIRFFYHRPRPFMLYHVHQLISEREWSFPSGHATFFFAIAAAIYFYNKKWGIAFFLAALVMGIARVVAGVHWPSDIIGGALVGIASAWLVNYAVERSFKDIEM